MSSGAVGGSRAFGRRSGGIGASLARAAPPAEDRKSELKALVPDPAPAAVGASKATPAVTAERSPNVDLIQHLSQVKERVMPFLLDRIDTAAAAQLNRAEISEAFSPVISEVLTDLRVMLNQHEQSLLEKMIVNDLTGLGPIEELLADDSVSDILINGPRQVYVERHGKLELTDVCFRDEDHLFQIAQRICNGVGRRIDQSVPLADARLHDGSRVNIVVQPLSLRGPTVSIRKFTNKSIGLDALVAGGSCSEKMASLLKIAGACRFNIVVSGGTGSGKTTLLNALSQMISPGERIITIEDAAELRLQQPHVITLETRPMNVEGAGAVTIRDLMINALRMRPDRIILGEVRGAECFDLLQAMNTGHDGSMCTLHANSPREALMRMENMVLMSDLKVPRDTIVRQIAESIDLIVQVQRLRDGSRRITSITEVTGFDEKVVLSQELFRFDYVREAADGRIIGEYRSTGTIPHCLDKARQFDLKDAYLEACR